LVAKRAKFLLTPVLLALVLGLVAWGFQRHYRRQHWDPETVALVNGKPIPREALDEVMGVGPGPSAPPSGPGSGGLAIRSKLDRLIDEELVVQAAGELGVAISQGDIDRGLLEYRDSWACRGNPASPACQPPKGRAMASYAQAVAKRLMLREVARLVAVRRASFDTRRWRAFWRQFLARHALASIYRVRIMLAQDDPAVEAALAGAPGDDDVERLANRVREAGFTAMVTQPMSLNLLDPETYSMFERVGLRDKLQAALKTPGRRSGPVRLDGSLAVFEVIRAEPRPDPASLAAAARAAYERMEGERAFLEWLAELRGRAVIVVNPGFQEFGLEAL
jgi:hypothetical protein